jgi:hypothetical protein
VKLARLILGAAILILTGCVSDRDIANNPQYPSDFRENTIYYTRVPLVLGVVHRSFPASTEIEGVADSDTPPPPDKPQSLSPYKTYELLPVGTPIRIVRIHRFYAYMDVGSSMIIDAKLLSGPHQGVDVNIDSICNKVDSPTIDKGLLIRNRDILSDVPPKP